MKFESPSLFRDADGKHRIRFDAAIGFVTNFLLYLGLAIAPAADSYCRSRNPGMDPSAAIVCVDGFLPGELPSEAGTFVDEVAGLDPSLYVSLDEEATAAFAYLAVLQLPLPAPYVDTQPFGAFFLPEGMAPNALGGLYPETDEPAVSGSFRFYEQSYRWSDPMADFYRDVEIDYLLGRGLKEAAPSISFDPTDSLYAGSSIIENPVAGVWQEFFSQARIAGDFAVLSAEDFALCYGEVSEVRTYACVDYARPLDGYDESNLLRAFSTGALRERNITVYSGFGGAYPLVHGLQLVAFFLFPAAAFFALLSGLLTFLVLLVRRRETIAFLRTEGMGEADFALYVTARAVLPFFLSSLLAALVAALVFEASTLFGGFFAAPAGLSWLLYFLPSLLLTPAAALSGVALYRSSPPGRAGELRGKQEGII